MSETVTRDQFTYWTEIEVRWGDMDAQGHVNNAVYFTYCEIARVKLLGEMGARGRADGPHGPALVTTTCDFRKQVVYPARLDVGVCVEEVGRRSFRMIYGIFFHGTDELAAAASSVNAWVDYEAGRAVPVPDWLRADLDRYRGER
ncbi:MAG: acyl-CoA thioesterase [Blastocatellales bacterium]|nr:acyl-CoA thioesterase [Blastocatellales bacterium]